MRAASISTEITSSFTGSMMLKVFESSLDRMTLSPGVGPDAGGWARAAEGRALVAMAPATPTTTSRRVR